MLNIMWMMLVVCIGEQVVQQSDIVFIAVKPQYVSVVMKEVKPYLTDKHIIVSIAAGITLANLKVGSLRVELFLTLLKCLSMSRVSMEPHKVII